MLRRFAAVTFCVMSIALGANVEAENVDSLSSAYNNIANSIEVRYIDSNAHLDLLWNGGANWNFEDLSAMTGAPLPATTKQSLPTTSDTATGSFESYYVEGSRAQIIQLYYTGSWHPQDLTLNTGTVPSAAIPLASVFDPIVNASEVYYKGNDSHLHQLFSVAGAAWQGQDMTTLTGASLPSDSNIAVLYDAKGSSMEVYYIDQNLHVIQLYFVASSGWHVQDLSLNTGAPLPDSSSRITAVHDPVFNTQEVYYVDHNQHLQQLWSDGTGWFPQDLTTVIGFFANRYTLSSVYNPIFNSVEVYFYTYDAGAMEYELCRAFYSGGWTAENVTLASHAPFPDPSLLVSSIYDPIVNSLEVYYVSGRQVIQLYNTGSGWHAQNLSAATNAPLTF